MYKEKIKYLILIVVTIILGLLSRTNRVVPLFVGDFLWAVMMYFIVRFVFYQKHIKYSLKLSLLICYMIEVSQLYQAPWINSIRNTLLGHLILGKGFLWSVLIAYTGGVMTVFILEKLIEER